MFTKKAQFDCVIIGGGPAGCVLACTLAGWGKSVCLLEKGTGPHPFPMQSVSEEGTAILKRNGIMTSAREHGHARGDKRVLIWGDGTPQILNYSKEECGIRVDRDLLDPDLRNLARAMKVTVFEGARVSRPLPENGQGDIHFDVNGKACCVQARVIVVASGRTHQAALLPLALEHQAPDLFALTASIHCQAKIKDQDVLEAIEEGWFWWFTGGGLNPQIALFTATPPHLWQETATLAERLLARSLHSSFALEKGSVRYLNTTPRLVSTSSDILLVGDAAGTIDPLVGRGLESTMVAAETAAIAVNTMIEKPDLRRECISHMVSHEKSRYFDNLSAALGLYLREARYSDKRFWQERHELCQVEIGPNQKTGLPMKLKVADAVGRFPTLKRKGKLLERVVGMGKPGGPVHQSALGIPIPQILELVNENHWTDEVLACASHHHDLYVHSRAKLTRALSELCRLGLLESAEDPAA